MYEVKSRLLVNGLDYIVEAFDRLHISEHDPREIKYVIRDLVSGVEILLKQFLVPENWTLVVRGGSIPSDEKFKLGEFVSVGMDELKESLEMLCPEVGIAPNDFTQIKLLKLTRNKLEHFTGTFECTAVLPVVFFVARFVLRLILRNKLAEKKGPYKIYYENIIRSFYSYQNYVMKNFNNNPENLSNSLYYKENVIIFNP